MPRKKTTTKRTKTTGRRRKVPPKNFSSGGSYPSRGRMPRDGPPYIQTVYVDKVAPAAAAAPSRNRLREIRGTLDDITGVLRSGKNLVDSGKALYDMLPSYPQKADAGTTMYDETATVATSTADLWARGGGRPVQTNPAAAVQRSPSNDVRMSPILLHSPPSIEEPPSKRAKPSIATPAPESKAQYYAQLTAHLFGGDPAPQAVQTNPSSTPWSRTPPASVETPPLAPPLPPQPPPPPPPVQTPPYGRVFFSQRHVESGYEPEVLDSPIRRQVGPRPKFPNNDLPPVEMPTWRAARSHPLKYTPEAEAALRQWDAKRAPPPPSPIPDELPLRERREPFRARASVATLPPPPMQSMTYPGFL